MATKILSVDDSRTIRLIVGKAFKALRLSPSSKPPTAKKVWPWPPAKNRI